MRSLDVIRLLATGLLALQVPAVAEDIDLFLGISPESGDKPNVLFVIDNGSNFSASAAERRCIIEGVPTYLDKTSGAIEQCALYDVIKTLADDKVRIGIMFYNGTGVVDYKGNATTCHPGGSNYGGCLAYPITVLNDESRPALLNWIRNWKTNEKIKDGFQIKGDGQATGAVMQEAWAYYKGRMGISDRNYAGMKPPGGICGKSDFVIFIGNSYNSSGSPGDQPNDRGPKKPLEGGFTGGSILKNASPAATAPQRAVMNPTITTSCGAASLGSPHETKGYYADEWSRYMFANGITTYSIGVLGTKCQADYAALLTNMADKSVGGGKYFATSNYDDLKLAISTILSEVQAVNSVFASVSLPVSVNPQGYYLNQIYVGMFRPDGSALPRWVGNLKQYKLGRDESGKGLRLEDADDEPAISNISKGFISECARSYWSPDDPDTYWTPFDSLSEEKKKAFFNCNLVSPTASSNFPDGNVVEKGGQGYVLRGLKSAESFTRTVTTCDATCSALANFASDNADITKERLGNAAMTDPARDDLIAWVRGANNKGTEESFVASTAVRASVHGDVVHSRPVAINFGLDTLAARKIVVFYGANDGILRAVNGNRGDDDDPGVGAIASVKAGAELWSFVAPETYSSLNRLRNNTLPIKYKGSATGTPKQYGIDGPITAYQSGDSTWIFTAMRRGGRAVYAFDVSDIATDPDSPTLKWKAGCDDAGCSSGFDDIGQTWSTPIPMAKVNVDGTVKPMLIMGGGYDPCEDSDPPDSSCKTSGKGNGIYLLDADTGRFETVFPTDRPVVGDVVVINDDETGLPKWVYAADLGGNVYRISQASGSGINNVPIGDSDPTRWDITKIASLGCDDNTCSDGEVNRKFMFGPDVVDEDGTYHILLGSGDREKPLDDWDVTYNVKNLFFMIKDRPEDPENLAVEDGSSLCETGSGRGVMCLDSLAFIDLDADPTDPDLLDEIGSKRGWYLELEPHEQVVTSAITVFGITTFSTHTPTAPDPDSCEPDLGTAKVYNIDYLNSAGYGPDGVTDRSVEIKGGGLPPSPVAGRVLLDDETKPVAFIIGAEGTSPLEAKLPPSPNPNKQPKGWTYWFIGK